MVTLANLNSFVRKGIEVTVIQPSEYHYYSGMGPGMLGTAYSADEIRFATRKVVEKQGGAFVPAKASAIDPEKQLVRLEDSDRTLPYDVLSCNAGSFVPTAIVSETNHPDIFTVKPIESLLRAQQRILELSRAKSIDIAVVGGGPSSVEIGGNVWRLCRESGLNPPRIRIYAGKKLLSRVHEKIGRMARESLRKRGIDVLENSYVERIEPDRIILKNGETHPANIIFTAVGVKPSPIFAASGLPTGPDGGLRVNQYLQCVSHANIFGGGDCIYFEKEPLDKVGVYAVRENPILYQNLMASLEGRSLQPFDPGGSYLLIYNLGDGTGIFCKWSIIFGGPLAFRIKDSIDRRFMAKFQAMER
ncbi:MAG: pyridine nucleotide-disulfide oxidoreductase [Desulfobulbaceae bacterium DB1]|nr:MAG: pyridine nucleotide-disulfide oxidoreductase [Desulfobulbaceae bacterium DB1]